MLKKVTCIFLILILGLSLFACNPAPPDNPDNPDKPPQTQGSGGEGGQGEGGGTGDNGEENPLELWRESIFSQYNKFYTFSLDDGVTQDEKFIALLNKYGLKATFNINTGLLGDDSTENLGGVRNPLDNSLVTHKMVTREQVENGLYQNNELASHTYSHPSLVKDVTDEVGITSQINSDFENIKAWSEQEPVGLAYPGLGIVRKWTCGNMSCKDALTNQPKVVSMANLPDWCPSCGQSNTFTKQNMSVELDPNNGLNISASAIRHIKNNTAVKYGRTIDLSYSFDLPRDFMLWNPTCSFRDAYLMNYAQNFNQLSLGNGETALFYVYGHTYEFDMADPTNPSKNDWDRIESFLQYMSQIEGAICLTNKEVYNLFSDKIPTGATKIVTMSFDDGTTYDQDIATVLNKNKLPATFFVNSGVTGERISGLDNVTRLSDTQIINAINGGFYYGHDISSHGYTHAPGGFAVNNERNPEWSHERIINEMQNDLNKITTLSGKKPLGCAYPGGATYLCDEVINVIKYYTDVKFARYTGDTYSFNIPTDWMKWQPTCEIIANGNVVDLFNEFLELEMADYQLFYLWDHPWAVVQNGCLLEFEGFCSAVKDASNKVVCLTNTEFYKLFANNPV